MNRSESRYFATAARMDEAFLTLLAKKDFEYITIKEICEVAGVNRSTFYLHYETMSDLLSESVGRMNEQFLASMEKDSDAFSTKLRNCPRDELYLITPDYLTPYLSYIKNNKRLFRTATLRITSDCSAQQQKMRRCWGWIKAMIGCSVMCLRRFSTATVYYSKIDLISWPFIFGD